MRQPFSPLVGALAVFVPLAWLGAGDVARGADAETLRNAGIGGILYNEDDSHRFVLDPAGQMKPERLDALVDELADSRVTAMLVCCCAKKTNFPSTSWEPHCEGFDPAKDNTQPFFGDAKPEDCNGVRRWAHNLRVMLESGVDPTGRMLDRCRRRGISPWVSIRMNDVHDAPLRRSALHSRFWTDHPEYWRYPDRFTAWNDRCLNYRLEPVRDHAMALVREVCDRYDMDGLELDWNRFPLHFREGEEAEGARLLTEWMAEARRVVRAAEKKWNHPILLVPRVPARPEVAVGTGLDAVTWAKRGLIDHLIVAPFWTTTDYDVPVERWLELLEGTGVGVTAGLEIRIAPYPGAKTLPSTPERRRGAAMAALGRGSQGIYLFNHFDLGSRYPELLQQLSSIEALRGKDRNYAVTFVDINVPGKRIPPALPKKLGPGESAEFRLSIGPKPIEGARGEVHLGLAAAPDEPIAAEVRVNDQPTTAGEVFSFGRDALRDGYNVIRVRNGGASAVTVQRVELCVRFPSD